MTEPSSPRKRPYVPRRGVRPILHRLGQTGFEGLEILEEYPELQGFVLWTAFRNAHLWAGRTENGQLFSAAAASHEDLVRRLPDDPFSPVKAVLTDLLRIAVSAQVDPEMVGSACLSVALWSEGQSKLGTAVEFAQVATLAEPRQAMHAAQTGRLLKLRAEWARAWSWFDHAIFLARIQADWHSYAFAYSSLGSMYLERGNLPLARRALRRSLRVASRHRLSERVAVACHNLFAVESIAGNWEKAERYVVRALQRYPERSHRRPRLARDLAYRWILRGNFQQALPLSLEVLEHFTAPADRTLVWSDIARAAAAVGETEMFERAWAEVWVSVERSPVEQFATNILLNLAHGAAFRGDESRARITASRALELAKARREAQSILEAEALLDSLRAVGSDVRPPACAAEPSEGVAEAFLSSLRRERAAV